MANQNANQPASLGNLFGVVGFITGCIIGWNSTENVWAALICGLIVGGLGVAVGNFVQKLLVIAVSILITVGQFYCRREVLPVILDSARQSPTTTQSSVTSARPVTPTSAKVIVRAANLRPKPSGSNAPSNKPLMELEMGERLGLLSPDHNGGGWYQVRHSGTGQEGWVYGDAIELE